MSRENFINYEKNHGNASYRRSKKQEKSLAKNLGGEPIPGSGSGAQKGDVRVKGFVRIEAKTTKHKSFSVTRDMVDKIENAALPNNEIPVLAIEFIDEQGNPEKELYIIPSYAFQEYLEGRTNEE